MSGYPAVSVANSAEELNRLHAEIEGKMRSTVQDAIRAGEILAQVKERLPHGDFLPWVKLNCRFSEDTAERYRHLFDHADKIRTVRNLQEAYKQIESIEALAKQSEEHRSRLRVDEYNRTGNKAAGWRKGTDDKLAQEEKDRGERIKKMQADLRHENAEWISKSGPQPSIASLVDEAKGLLMAQAETLQKRQSFKEKIRVSHEGKDDPFVDAIMDYLDSLGDDNRRVEACYNIIKVCKRIAIEIQQAVQA